MHGVGDGVRTRDINVGNVALYQLSYSDIGAPTEIRTPDPLHGKQMR